MKRELFTRYSNELGRDMNVLVFGEKGYPLVVFPTQDGAAANWEDCGMVEALQDYVEDGRIQLFCTDAVDAQSWSDIYGDKEQRAEMQESYHSYVCHELIPFVHEANKSELLPLAAGCGLGATQAAISALRRPDLFTGCIALSGIYSTSYYFGDWMNGTLYENDVPTFLANMPEDHYYIDLYNQRQIVLCVGQGAWEDGVEDLRSIASSFARLGIDAWCDFWGFDVSHEWPWWKKQMLYFLPEVLADIKRHEQPQVAEKSAAQKKAAPEKKAAPQEKVETEKKPVEQKKAAPEKKAAPQEKAEDLSALTVAELRARAKKAGIAASKLRKAELIAALEQLA